MIPKLSGIYMIRNIENNHIYIGQSVDINRRWSNHKSLLRFNKHYSSYLQRAWNLYTECKFEFTILYLCEAKSIILQEAEQFYMDLLKPEYNLCSSIPTNIGHSCSDEVRAKISASNKGKPKSEETKQRISKAKLKISEDIRLGLRPPITQSDEAKKSRSESFKSRPVNPNLSFKGHKLTEEQKAQLLAINLGKKASDETKAKLSAAKKGKPKSKETKQRMREAQLRMAKEVAEGIRQPRRLSEATKAERAARKATLAKTK